jgi:nucleoside-diphosphate-sugar epimerase
MSSLADARLPKGSTILITGITGYIGSWVADEALALGYKVRGAVRSLEKASWLQEVFDAKFPGQYTQVALTDVADKSQLEAAVKGVAGIAHTAINSNMSPEPEPYIPNAIKETLAVLEVAQKDGGVKAIVLTSSSMAAIPWGATGTIPKDAYNEEYIKLAWDAGFSHPAKMFFVYAAAKAQAEQAAWKYVKENSPGFTVNTVLPSCNFGPSVSYEKQGHASTGGWPKQLYEGELSFISNVPPQNFIDVRDCAKLHVAALVDPETSNERLWGFAEAYNWNSVLTVFRKIFPERKFVDDIEGLSVDESVISTESALKALKDVYGQSGWTSLETSLKDTGFDKA